MRANFKMSFVVAVLTLVSISACTKEESSSGELKVVSPEPNAPITNNPAPSTGLTSSAMFGKAYTYAGLSIEFTKKSANDVEVKKGCTLSADFCSFMNATAETFTLSVNDAGSVFERTLNGKKTRTHASGSDAALTLTTEVLDDSGAIVTTTVENYSLSDTPCATAGAGLQNKLTTTSTQDGAQSSVDTCEVFYSFD